MTIFKVRTITEDSEIPEELAFKKENQYCIASSLTLNKNEINQKIFLTDIALLFSGYQTFDTNDPFHGGLNLSEKGHLLIGLHEKIFPDGSKETLIKNNLINQLLQYLQCDGLQVTKTTELRLPKKWAYLLFVRGEYESTKTIRKFFSAYPSKECFNNCEVKDDELEDFLLGIGSFKPVDGCERERISGENNEVIFEEPGAIAVTVDLLKKLAQEAPQLKKILFALAQWSNIENRRLKDLKPILTTVFKGKWVEGKDKKSCSKAQLEAIEKVFMPPPPRGAGNKKKFGSWDE